MNILKAILRFLFARKCPSCGNRDLYFSHEEHFTPGCPNVYVCESCNQTFVGKDIGAQQVLKKLVASGHQIILWTMRSDGQESGDVLSDAVEWFH